MRDVEVDSPVLCGAGFQPAAGLQPAFAALADARGRPVGNRPQVENLPHKGTRGLAHQVRSDSSGFAGESPPRALRRRTPDGESELVLGGMRGYDEWFMKLPNGDRAIVEIRKLLEYCLNSQHPRGRNKARVFASVGIRETDAEELRSALLAAAEAADAESGVANVYGQRYIVDFDLVRQGRVVRIRSTWIVRIGEGLPRLTSCYVL